MNANKQDAGGEVTNPDNVGGLVWYVCTSCLLMVQLPSDTPTLGRCQCSPKGWSLRRAKLPKGYELCRATPAGGDRDPLPTHHCQNGRSDICLAANYDGVCCPDDSCDIDDGVRDPRPDSAPAGSGEVDRMIHEIENEARRLRVIERVESTAAWLERIAALLRKLQQGAVDVDYKLPCDVRVAPATTINKGCKLGTLIECIKLREEWGSNDADK